MRCSRLLQQGNSVLVVEHDLAVIQAADWVLDLGPGAGPARRLGRGRRPARSTGGRRRFRHRAVPRRAGRSSRRMRARDWHERPGWIEIRGASLHNLKAVDARIPLGCPHLRDGCERLGKEHAGARRARAIGAPLPCIARAIEATRSRVFPA